MTEIRSIVAALDRAAGRPAALATLVAVKGSSYRRPGARMLLLPDGTRLGAISGGCLEEDIACHLAEVLKHGRPELVTYDTTAENDLVWGVGLGCEGVVQVLLDRIPAARPAWIAALAARLNEGRGSELCVRFAGAPAGDWGTFQAAGAGDREGEGVFHDRIEPPPRLVVFGAGADALPLSGLAALVGWRVTIADSRPALATRARFPEADSVLVVPAESLDEHVELDGETFVVVMTHRFQEDLRLLRVLIARPLAYLGLLGARRRSDRLLAELDREGVAADPQTGRNLCSPIGLDLGADTPETIALAILAEMQCRRTARVPLPLRERNTAIHG